MDWFKCAFYLYCVGSCILPLVSSCGDGGEQGVCENPDDNNNPPALSRRLTKEENNDEQPLECGLYLAESTLPGAGLGVFTGVEKAEGESVSEGDVCIPFIDM